MRLCASTYSFGKYAANGFFYMADKAKEMGYDGIEIVPGSFENSTDIEFAKKCALYCKDIGLEITAVCTGADLLSDTEGQVQKLCRDIDLCHAYTAGIMRHDVAYGSPLSYEKCLPVLAGACKRVAEYAKGLGIRTCTENHGFFSQDSQRVESLVNEVDCENFGLLIDVGNFLCADEEPTVAVGRLAKYAFHVHCKDFYVKSGCEIDPGQGWFRSRAGNYLKGTVVGYGNAHAPQSLGILKRAGYDGPISVEFEGAEDNLFGLQAGIENVKRFWSMF